MENRKLKLRRQEDGAKDSRAAVSRGRIRVVFF